jgi:hypothetical protein
MTDKRYTRFRHLAIEGAQSSPTGAEIAAVEQLLGARLPTSYLEFLSVANGGYLDYVVDVTFPDGHSEQLCFAELFSTDDADRFGTLIGEIRRGRQTIELPVGVLPFAGNGASSLYMDLSRDGEGRVIAFVHGLPAWTGLRTESEYIELAASFDAYVDMLRIDRADAMEALATTVKTIEHVEATEEWLDIGLPQWRDDAELSAAVAQARRRVSGK